MSSSKMYEGVMSLPPPNHHRPGKPSYSSVSKYLDVAYSSVCRGLTSPAAFEMIILVQAGCVTNLPSLDNQMKHTAAGTGNKNPVVGLLQGWLLCMSCDVPPRV